MQKNNRTAVVIVVAVITALFVGASVYAWQKTAGDRQAQTLLDHATQQYQSRLDAAEAERDALQEKVDKATADAKKAQDAACAFSKDISLKKSESGKLSMFGDDVFESAVCGYLVHYQEEVFGVMHDRAYVRVTSFADPAFQKSVQDAIAAGNSVNKSEPDGSLDFSLGCMENDDIKTDKLVVVDAKGRPVNVPEAINPDVRRAILASSASQPVRLVLAFGIHEGADAVCASLAHTVRLY